MRYLSYVGWLSLVLYLNGCALGKDKDETPYKHNVCVLADKHSKVQDERYVCTVTARFRSLDACKTWQSNERQEDPSAYNDGHVTTKCD